MQRPDVPGRHRSLQEKRRDEACTTISLLDEEDDLHPIKLRKDIDKVKSRVNFLEAGLARNYDSTATFLIEDDAPQRRRRHDGRMPQIEDSSGHLPKRQTNMKRIENGSSSFLEVDLSRGGARGDIDDFISARSDDYDVPFNPMMANRWSTSTFNDNDANYPTFIRGCMQQDPSFSMAAALQKKLLSLAPTSLYIDEYKRAIARVMLLADADRNELKQSAGGVWGTFHRGRAEGWCPRDIKYSYVLNAMRNERPSFALAMRLAAWSGKETHLSESTAHVKVLRDCIATVADIEECSRQQLIDSGLMRH